MMSAEIAERHVSGSWGQACLTSTGTPSRRQDGKASHARTPRLQTGSGTRDHDRTNTVKVIPTSTAIFFQGESPQAHSRDRAMPINSDSKGATRNQRHFMPHELPSLLMTKLLHKQHLQGTPRTRQEGAPSDGHILRMCHREIPAQHGTTPDTTSKKDVKQSTIATRDFPCAQGSHIGRCQRYQANAKTSSIDSERRTLFHLTSMTQAVTSTEARGGGEATGSEGKRNLQTSSRAPN
jgi:hypothetical protein